MLVAEVRRCGGIPELAYEEFKFREAFAEFVLTELGPCQELDPREPIQMNLLDLLEKEETK